MKCIALDAMGVIYQVQDDVTDLLYPFIVERGGLDNYARLVEVYIDASLGRLPSAELWEAMKVDPALEDEYLARHRLSEGLREFLDAAESRGLAMWCLSNDVSEWSRKLRRMHNLERRFKGFIISGDVGLRKPDPAIYELLLERSECTAGDMLFVDDNAVNLNAARTIGLSTVLFDPSGRQEGSGHPIVKGFTELRALISRLR